MMSLRSSFILKMKHRTLFSSSNSSFKRFTSSHSSKTQHSNNNSKFLLFLTGTTSAAAALATAFYLHHSSSSPLLLLPTTTTTTQCEVQKRKSTDILIGAVHKEPSTGILFPQLCNGMTFVGCGVRVKYGFVKVYAVGTYIDTHAMTLLKSEPTENISKALCNPMYPRTIRIVMNRGLSIEKYTKAIVEALEPRMKGQDLEKLEEFQKLNPSIDLIEGATMEMTIRGNTMLYKNSVGSVGAIHSQVFCEAMCDVYYGNDAVSKGHREDVIKGIQKL